MALSDDGADGIARRQAALIDALARAAFARMWRALGEDDTSPREAIRAAQAEFGGAFAEALAAAFSELLQRSVGVAQVRALPVGDLRLSRHLYRHHVQTAHEVLQVIKEHAQGVHQAQELALRLYDGYDPHDGVIRPLEGRARVLLPRPLRELTADPAARQSLARLVEQGQQQAARLKSRPLRAAYAEALDAWQAGAGQEALKRRLDVAAREKNRYFANRIAQTELARAHQAQVGAELMADDTIDVVQVRINPAHPKTDICDLHARADLWGLGPGNYPKARAPRPPFHPHCWCRLRSRPSLSAAGAFEVPAGRAAYLRSLPPDEAARVMGSRDRLQRVLGGASVDAVVNAGVDPLYRLARLGDGVGHPLVENAGVIDPVAFGRFFNNEPGAPDRVVVAKFTAADRALFKTSAEVLWLSRISLNEHRKRHPEVTADDYMRVPDIVRGGQVWAGHQDRRYLLLQVAGRPYRAALKVDGSGAEAWFLSLVVSPKQKPPRGAVRIR